MGNALRPNHRGVFDERFDMDSVVNPVLRAGLEQLRREGIGLKQLVTELERLYTYMGDRKFESFVELGCWQGGTALLFSSFVKKGGRITLVDWLGNHNDFKKASRVVELLNANGYVASLLKQSTRDAYHRVSGMMVKGISYLHIDADHRYEGVKWDFENYAPLVRQRGVIQLHDITMRGWSNPKHEFGVHKLWAELRPRFGDRMTEIVDETYDDPQPRVEGHVGIGLIAL